MSKFLSILEFIRNNNLNEGIQDILKPKSEEEIIKNVIESFDNEKDLDYKFIKLEDFNRKNVLHFLSKEKIRIFLIEYLKYKSNRWIRGGMEQLIRDNIWIRNYLTKEEIDKFIFNFKMQQFKSKYPELEQPKSLKDLLRIEKEQRKNVRQTKVNSLLKLIKDDLPYKSIHRILDERIKLNQFTFLYEILYWFNNHKGSSYIIEFIEPLFELLDDKLYRIERSFFNLGSARDQWGLNFIEKLITKEILIRQKEGNKQYVIINRQYKDDNYFVSNHYYEMLKILTKLIEENKIEGLYENNTIINKPQKRFVIDIKNYKLR